MKSTPTACATALLLAVTSTFASAESKVTVASPSNDKTVYRGDLLTFTQPLAVKYVPRLGAGPASDACLPPNTTVRGIGKVSVKEGDAEPELRDLFEVTATVPKAGNCDKDAVQPGAAVAIPASVLTQTVYSRRGFTYGALSVPFKYQLRGDRGMSGGGTLGGYAGYRNTWGGTSTQYIFFAGATEVDVPTEKDGKPTTDSLFGFSYGIGVLWTLKDEFTVGLVIGADRVTKSAGYVNNGKPWMSFSLGYDFLK